MSELTVRLDSRPEGFIPGGDISGRVVWDLSPAPQKLEIRLFWYTRGRGTRDIGIIGIQTLDKPSGRGEQTFSFSLPDGPYSFSGKLISLVWAVELVVPESGENARTEFFLSPDGREVLLGKKE